MDGLLKAAESIDDEDVFSFKKLFVPLTRSKAIKWIVILGIITFFNALFCGFVWDDESFVTKNVYVQQFNIEKILTTNVDAGEGIKSNYYRPFISLTFATDALVWKQNAFGFHLTNVVFHIGTGIILFLLLTELGFTIGPAFVISLIFLVHPVQTEAVTYISSRGDSMYAFFLFAALYFLLKGIRKQKTLYYYFSLLLFAISILSKETAVSTILLFPAIIFIESLKTKQALTTFLKKQKKLLITLSGMVLLVASYLVLRITALNFADILNFSAQTNYTLTSQQFYATHLDVRLFTFAKVLWIDFGILLLPHQLHMYRIVTYVMSFFSLWVISAILLGIVVVSIAIFEIRKYHTAFILFGFAIAVTTLLPVSGIVPINWVIFEHWLYVPIVGFLIILIRLMQLFIPRQFVNKLSKLLITYLFIILMCIYASLTIYQNSIWTNAISLYSYTLHFTETAPIDNNLAMSYSDNGQSEQAIYYYNRALRIVQYPQIYNNLALEYQHLKKYDLAENAFRQAITISPEFSGAKINLINLYLIEGQYDKALKLSNNSPQVEAIINNLKSKNNAQ